MFRNRFFAAGNFLIDFFCFVVVDLLPSQYIFLMDARTKERDFYCVYYYRDDDENVSLLKLSFCI